MKRTRVDGKRQWNSAKAPRVLAALLRHGWRVKRQEGSHRILARPGWPNYVFAYHDRTEIGPTALEFMSKKTGLKPEDL
jgi:predicted RNA binding protein YcfA (HicA-like mRNA interferase family)